MMQNETHPFIVIQYSELEQFIAECQREEVDTIRIWSGITGKDGSLSTVTRFVCCQVVTQRNHVLMCSIVVGRFAQMGGKPFGPVNEHVAQRIEELMNAAEARIKALIVGGFVGVAAV